MCFYITWIESHKGEQVEELLDERQIPIDMLPTPQEIRNVDAMVCKDCFEVYLKGIDIDSLKELPFPQDTACYDGQGVRIWNK